MTKKAFTLVELLVVITIVAILAMLAVGSYGSARRAARLDIVGDSIVSYLKEAQSNARTGTLRPQSTSLPLGETGIRCYGLDFSVSPESGEPSVHLVNMPYLSVGQQGADYCDLTQAEKRRPDFLEDFVVKDIQEFGLSVNYLLVLFKPPFGKLLLGDSSQVSVPGTQGTPEVFLTVGLPQGEGERTVRMNTVTEVIERINAETQS